MAGDVQVRPATPAAGGQLYLQGSTSQQVKSGDGWILGIFVSSASATPTIKLWDSLTAANAILVDTFTPAPGWWPIPLHFRTGLFITVSGTVAYTVSFH